jgi:hypothetical protein
VEVQDVDDDGVVVDGDGGDDESSKSMIELDFVQLTPGYSERHNASLSFLVHFH